MADAAAVRKPTGICARSHGRDCYFVVCDDGSVWEYEALGAFRGHANWHQVSEVPGSPAALKAQAAQKQLVERALAERNTSAAVSA